MQKLPEMSYKPRNPDYENDARTSFANQGIMQHLGASMRSITPGCCVIELPFREQLTQQDGYFHAGATSTIADSAGGYAAYSLMPAGSRVLTVEFKINLIAPAKGERLLAEASVIKAGKTLSVASINVYSVLDDETILCAVVQQTTICISQTDT